MKRLLTAAVLCTVLILGSVWSIKAVDNTAQAVVLMLYRDRAGLTAAARVSVCRSPAVLM